MFNIKFSLCCCFFCFYAKLKLIEIIQFEVLQTTILSFFSGCCFKKTCNSSFGNHFWWFHIIKIWFSCICIFPFTKIALGTLGYCKARCSCHKKKIYIYITHIISILFIICFWRKFYFGNLFSPPHPTLFWRMSSRTVACQKSICYFLKAPSPTTKFRPTKLTKSKSTWKVS